MNDYETSAAAHRKRANLFRVLKSKKKKKKDFIIPHNHTQTHLHKQNVRCYSINRICRWPQSHQGPVSLIHFSQSFFRSHYFFFFFFFVLMRKNGKYDIPTMFSLFLRNFTLHFIHSSHRKHIEK